MTSDHWIFSWSFSFVGYKRKIRVKFRSNFFNILSYRIMFNLFFVSKKSQPKQANLFELNSSKIAIVRVVPVDDQLERRRREKTPSVSKKTQISSIIRLRNCCGWPFNLVGCSKVAHLESKKKSTQKPVSIILLVWIKSSAKPTFFLHVFVEWKRQFFLLSFSKFTMCDLRKPSFYLSLYFCLYGKFSFLNLYFSMGPAADSMKFNWN